MMALLSLSFISFTSCTSDETLDNDSGYTPNTDSEEEEDDTLFDSIATYDYPDVIVDGTNNLGYIKRSEFFEVEVSNTTDSYDVYVMADRNCYQMSDPTSSNSVMTNHNHYANFSFSGSVTVTVRRIDNGSVADGVVYPKQKGYDYSIDGDELKINLTERAYIYVEFPDLEHEEPLFIFADPKETDVPLKTASNVELIDNSMSMYDIKSLINSTEKEIIYFSEGVYDIPSITSIDYAGYQLPLLSNKKYYIPGGTVIVGSFYGDDCANSKMYGRGVVTASGKERLSSDTSIPYNLYMQSGGDGNELDGILFCNPAHFAVLSRNDLVARNCKMTGWWHQTDGWGAGDNAVLEDCFFKSNDDIMKVYNDNQQVSNIVIYKQMNGAGIQFGWGSSGSASNSTVDGLYVVNDDIKTTGTPISNTAIINLRTNAGSTINGVTIKNVYVENDYQRFIGIDNVGGNFIDFTLDNIQIEGSMHNSHNYFVLRNGKGTYDNIVIKDLVINGTKVTSDDYSEWNLIQGYSDDDKGMTEYTNVVNIDYQ